MPLRLAWASGRAFMTKEVEKAKQLRKEVSPEFSKAKDKLIYACVVSITVSFLVLDPQSGFLGFKFQSMNERHVEWALFIACVFFLANASLRILSDWKQFSGFRDDVEEYVRQLNDLVGEIKVRENELDVILARPQYGEKANEVMFATLPTLKDLGDRFPEHFPYVKNTNGNPRELWDISHQKILKRNEMMRNPANPKDLAYIFSRGFAAIALYVEYESKFYRELDSHLTNLGEFRKSLRSTKAFSWPVLIRFFCLELILPVMLFIIALYAVFNSNTHGFQAGEPIFVQPATSTNPKNNNLQIERVDEK